MIKCRNREEYSHTSLHIYYMIAFAQNNSCQSEIVGLVPAAGEARRISPLPCSKELYPVGFHNADHQSASGPKVACHYLLEKMRLANIFKAYIILRKGKWDIPSYFGDGKMINMDLAYLIMDLSFGVPFTLDQAFPFVNSRKVAFGFPDVLLSPHDSFLHLIDHQTETDADLVLGLYPTNQPQKMDVVEVNEDGTIRSIEIKSPKNHNSDICFAWQTAFWTPVFTDYLHSFVEEQKKRISPETLEYSSNRSIPEVSLGEVFKAAIKDDLKLRSVVFDGGNCLDIGTHEDLLSALKANFTD